jgi:phosphate transport system permease protein
MLRDELLAALDAPDGALALPHLDAVLAHDQDAALKDTAAGAYFDIAREYRRIATSVDLPRREEYAQSLAKISEAMKGLLGPRPGQPVPEGGAMQRYGATRWDQAQQQLDQLLWDEQWVSQGPGRPLKKVLTPRAQQFAGTPLAELFPYVQQNAAAMLGPRWTFYGRFFTDDNVSSHYFGGVGPETLGTLLVTVLAVVVALPLGVVAAAYLVECAPDTHSTRALRTCINTLAGVPSIVFGLFGQAFFMLYLLPKFGLRRDSSIIAGSLTLAVLVLPVVIRASEEAIRTVPRAFREAALALGAGRLHCFLTVTLPAALPGILTGLILSMSRAAGETAPILFTVAVASGPVPRSLAQPTRTLSYGCYDMAVGDRIAMLAPHNLFGMVVTLVAIVLLLNAAAIALRGRVARRLRG